MHLENKVVFVTGGARGIGSACAKAVLERGAKVAIADIDETTGRKQADALKEEFGQDRAVFVRCDVSKGAVFKEAFNKAVEEFGNIDVMINNAGVLDEVDWERTVDINLKGVIHGTELANAHMRKDKGGRGGVIINIASVVAYNPYCVLAVYTGTKHAVLGYTRSLATSPNLPATGIRYACVCPDMVDTEMIEAVKSKCRPEFKDKLEGALPTISVAVKQMGVAVLSILDDDNSNDTILEVSSTLGLLRRKITVETVEST